MDWIIYGLMICCVVYLCCQYRNNFYLLAYLKNSINILRTKDKKIYNRKKIDICNIIIPIILLIIQIINIELEHKIIIILLIIFVLLMFKKFLWLVLVISIIFNIFLLINLFEWINKTKPLSGILLMEMFFVIIFLYVCKYILIILTQKVNFSYTFTFIVFFIAVFSSILFIYKNGIKKIRDSAITVTKGNLKNLKNGSIEVFFKEGRKKFSIAENNNGEFYIENDMMYQDYIIQKILFNKDNNISLFMQKIDTPSFFKTQKVKNESIEVFFKESRKKFSIAENNNGEFYIENDVMCQNYTIQKILFNKDNNISLFIQKIGTPSFFKTQKVKNGEIVDINNKNSKIKDNQNNEIDVDIEGKIIIVKEDGIDVENIKNYIFLDNNWHLLQNSLKIKIKEDNFYFNLLNLILFLFTVIYFWLKLYGKKSKEYYDKEIINEIKDTPILFDRNKYDKFLTLSMFGLTIPNIWKIMSTRTIGEMNKSIWTKIDFKFIILFSIVLFCLITSKEISECVKELENEKEEYIDIEYYI